MQNNKKLKARILSLTLSVVMVTTMIPATVFAIEGEGTALGVSDITECHVQHDKNCGYKEVLNCFHEHEESCYEEDAVATDNDAKNLVCIHEHGESCYENALNCQHEHDEECGYIAAFVESVAAIDKEYLIELMSAYRDALKAYEADTSGGESTEELAQLLAHSERAFTTAYESVEGVDGNSAKELYELLSDEDKMIETVRAAKETLDGIIAAVAELLPSANVALLSTEITVTSFSALQSAINSASSDSANPTTIVIGGDFDLTAAITLTGKHVKIISASGGPFTLTRATNFTEIAFAIKSSGSLTLENIVIDGNKSNVTSPKALISVVGTTFTMEDGAVLQNNKSSAITMSNPAAKVYMNGGTISGNESATDGGAINDSSYSGALIEISGGEIKENKAVKTGGAIKSTNAVTIAGGTISDNTAGTIGGGISIMNGGTLTMTAGVIQDNTATTNGNNVYLKGTGTILNIGGSASIPAGLTLEEKPKILISSQLQGNFGVAKIVTSPAVDQLFASATNSYTITAEDVTKFTYADDAFGFKLDGNQIKLATPTGVPEATTSNIYAKGIPLILVAGNPTATNTVIYIDKNGNGTVDEGTDKLWAPFGKDATTAGNNLSDYTIFGGDPSSTLSRNTSITMLGGKVKSIYGGSHSTAIIGDTYVIVSGGTVESDVFGGSYNSTVTGNTNVSMTGGNVRILYGGGSTQAAPISGNAQVTVSGGEATEIYGCGAYGSVERNVAISVSDGTISGNIYGGAQSSDTTVGGSVAISITGGTVTKNVYTGGYLTTTIAGTKSVTVGGNAKIGSNSNPYFYGIVINGGINQKGVDSFIIDQDLSTDASININLLDRYPALVGNPTIVTDAVDGDLSKVKLVGASATGLKAYFDGSDNTIKLGYQTAISRVDVTPNSAIVPLGEQKQFAATVAGTGSPEQTVTWNVVGGVSGTSISADGMLTVAANETADTLTVTAASSADSSKSGTATVSVRKLKGIAIKTSPTKTVYTAGESFDNSDMVVVAYYREGSGSLEQTITNYTISPNGALAISDTSITVSFTDCGAVKTATQAITANDKVSAVVPTIGNDLSTTEVPYTKDASATALSIVASVTDGGTLSYEWYSNITNSTTGGTKLSGTTASYTPSTAGTGTTYYYCIVKNTIQDNGDGGTKTATTTSKVAKITVNAAVTTHTITATSGSGGSISPSGTVAVNNGKSKTFSISANSNYSIASVLVDGVSQGAISTYTFSNVTGNHTISATFSYNGGGGSSSGGSSSTTTPIKPTEPVTGSSNTNATVDTNGNATVNVTDKNISDAVQAAKNAASRKGVNAGEVTAVINVTSPANSNPNTVTVNLPKTVQQQVINGKIGNLAIVIDKPDISIGMNLATITEMNKQANADIQLSATRTDATILSTEAKNAIGSRPAFDLTATYASGSKSVSNFGTGTVSVAIPYTLQAGEVAGGLYAVYVDGNGKVNYITNSSYDAENKVLRFSTNHFSVYGISYKAPIAFTDIANHWAKTDIEFVVNRGLMSGTSNTTFGPNTAMTRGMFVTALDRLAGVNTKDIVEGSTATTFAPDQSITRQEMAVIMSNYAKAMGYTIPETRAAVTFADNASIESWSAAAVKQMQMAGILNGKNSNNFDPTGVATRAEVSAMLHRFVSLLIDKSTTEGWTTNDSGSSLYYKSGKALVGAQTISGVAYTFNGYGETTHTNSN